MNNYIQNIKQYLREIHMNSKCNPSANLLDAIWFYRTQTNPACNSTEQFESISPTLDSLSKKRRRQLCRAVAELCIEHERIAFSEGFASGILLAHEIDAVEKEMHKETE